MNKLFVVRFWFFYIEFWNLPIFHVFCCCFFVWCSRKHAPFCEVTVSYKLILWIWKNIFKNIFEKKNPRFFLSHTYARTFHPVHVLFLYWYCKNCFASSMPCVNLASFAVDCELREMFTHSKNIHKKCTLNWQQLENASQRRWSANTGVENKQHSNAN